MICVFTYGYGPHHTSRSYESNDFVLIPAAFPEPDNKEPDREAPPTYWWELPLDTVTAVVSDSLRPHGLWPARLLCPWDFPGKNTGVGCCFLLQNAYTLSLFKSSPNMPVSYTALVMLLPCLKPISGTSLSSDIYWQLICTSVSNPWGTQRETQLLPLHDK